MTTRSVTASDRPLPPVATSVALQSPTCAGGSEALQLPSISPSTTAQERRRIGRWVGLGMEIRNRQCRVIIRHSVGKSGLQSHPAARRLDGQAMTAWLLPAGDDDLFLPGRPDFSDKLQANCYKPAQPASPALARKRRTGQLIVGAEISPRHLCTHRTVRFDASANRRPDRHPRFAPRACRMAPPVLEVAKSPCEHGFMARSKRTPRQEDARDRHLVLRDRRRFENRSCFRPHAAACIRTATVHARHARGAFRSK